MFGKFILNLILDVANEDDYYVVVGDSNSLGGKLNLNNTLAGIIAILLLVIISAVCTIWIIIKRKQYLQIVQNALDEKEEREKREKAEEERLMKENKLVSENSVTSGVNNATGPSSQPNGITVLPNINPKPVDVGASSMEGFENQSYVQQQYVGGWTQSGQPQVASQVQATQPQQITQSQTVQQQVVPQVSELQNSQSQMSSIETIQGGNITQAETLQNGTNKMAESNIAVQNIDDLSQTSQQSEVSNGEQLAENNVTIAPAPQVMSMQSGAEVAPQVQQPSVVAETGNMLKQNNTQMVNSTNQSLTNTNNVNVQNNSINESAGLGVQVKKGFPGKI